MQNTMNDFLMLSNNQFIENVSICYSHESAMPFVSAGWYRRVALF